MDASTAKEQVLVIPASRLELLGGIHGFLPWSQSAWDILMDRSYFSFRNRGLAEKDPTFKQLIPYMILHYQGQVFHYTRGSTGGESRLHSSRSIGVGGHVSRDDAPANGDPYRAGMMRELAEEVSIQCEYRERCLGFIYDDATEVSRVHLGVVHLLDLSRPEVTPREAALADASFLSMTNLLRNPDKLESWSLFSLQALGRERCDP